MHRDEGRHASTLRIGRAHEMARALGCDHDHIEILSWRYLAIMYVETVGEGEDGAFFEIGFDFRRIDCCNLLIWQQYHDYVCFPYRFSNLFYDKARLFRLAPGC